MKGKHIAGAVLLAGTAIALASCASRPVADGRPASPVVRPPQLAAAPGIMPINRDLGTDEMLWHLRAALNVAALACQGAAHSGVASQYNIMLERHKDALAAAYRAEEARFRQQYGSGWQSAFDQHQTRLYNNFADPRATAGLCEQASGVVMQVNGISSAELGAIAATALARIEQPFAAARTVALNRSPSPTPAFQFPRTD